MRGRKRIPSRIKILNGDKHKERIRGNEPQPDPTPPTCPGWLLPVAKREWRRVIPELSQLGLVTILDRVALAAYCQCYARWRQAEEVLHKEGLIHVHINKKGQKSISTRPEVAIAQQYLNLVKAFCVEFGMTPSSRGHMSIAPRISQDPMDKLLGTRRLS